MGISVSKAARKYPKAVSAVEHGAKSRSIPSSSAHLAESHKSEAIERDAADPHFLANLNKLGPVRVDHMQTIRADSTNTKFFESRSSETDLQPTRNRLYGFSISELLDKRKSVKTPEEEATLAEEFKIDVERLRSLARFVNSPSVDKARIRPAPGSKGEDNLIVTAIWAEPNIKTSIA